MTSPLERSYLMSASEQAYEGLNIAGLRLLLEQLEKWAEEDQQRILEIRAALRRKEAAVHGGGTPS